MTTPEARLQTSVGNLSTDIIKLSPDALGTLIANLISDVGQLHFVTTGDLKVYGPAVNSPPTSIEMAMKYGTKFFDAVYYFACETSKRPVILMGADVADKFPAEVILMKKRLLWTALFLMFRGSYPSSSGNTLGSDVPAFLVTTAGMNESPADVAAGLASFNLLNIPTSWIKFIPWKEFAPEIKQRLALGVAGYRSLGPFLVADCRPDAPPDVRAAFDWVRHVASQPPDYQILSATRSADLIAKLGSWNKALANLSLLCFTQEQLTNMVATKILFKMPVEDVRSNTWKSWATNVQIEFNQPIGLN